MTTKDVIDRAIGLADLQNSEYITQADKTASLNESYRDIYERITKADDDFFLKSATLSTASIVIIDINQFTIDLPTDFFKLRTVNWDDNGQWREIGRFPINQRNRASSMPSYRLRGGKLWISGVSTVGTLAPTIRIDYYPEAEELTVPESPLLVPGLAVVPTSMCYTPNGRTIIYTTGSDIHAYSLDTLIDSTILVSAGIADLGYLNGWVYFRRAGDVWRGSTTLTSVLVPVQLTALGTVLACSLMWGFVFYSLAAASWRMDLDGSNDVLQQAYPENYVASFGVASPSFAYITAGLLVLAPAVATGISVSQIAGDNHAIYYRTPTGEVYQYGATPVLLASGVAYLGIYGAGRLPLYMTDGTIQLLSTLPPVTLQFTENVAYEIMAYQCAADFKRKNNADAAALMARREELWNRFSTQVQADNYKPERIQNAYAGMGAPWR
jgi:hypothetical protein